MSPERTREPQYQSCVDLAEQRGRTQFGLMTNQTWHDNPRHLLFVLSRYKFVAKMLAGRERVLEVGCADAFGTRVVQQTVGMVTAIDFDPVFIEDVIGRSDPDWPLDARVHDIRDGPIDEGFDAAFALDVLEHIDPRDEERFLTNIAHSLGPQGVLVIGTPSVHSQGFASPASREGHVNCKDGAELRNLMERFFHNVFIYSMNDEVLHTGHDRMSHYLFAVATSRRD